jgi:ribose transport system substrate-binding protein
MNRALAGEEPSGYVAPPHLFDKNTFDPGNGYREAYKKIWGVE